MIGNPDSWDQTTFISGKDDYNSCTLSLCGRFVAAQTEASAEIRNQLTFQRLAVLRPLEKTSLLTGPLAYSSDGRSLACGFWSGIVIWDVQTGRVARSLSFIGNISVFVWLLDGKTISICQTHMDRSSALKKYDVASGAQLFAESFERESICRLWACEKSLRFLPVPFFRSSDHKLSVSGIGPTRVKTERLPATIPLPVIVAFSSPTYRITISDPDTLHILEARNSQTLLQESHSQSVSCFSSDASLFAAPYSNGFRVWKYTSSSYRLLGEYPLPHLPSFSPGKLRLKISPTSTSILSRYGIVLQVWRLHGPPTTSKTCRQHAAISRSGRYIATVHGSQTTVEIINLRSQAPSQFIDTGGEIEGLAITGNVLLVAFSEKVMGWLLTEEGRVQGFVEHRRAGHSDSVWTITSPPHHPKSLFFTILGQFRVIGTSNTFPFIYNTGTGGVRDSFHLLQQFDLPWITFFKQSDSQEYHLLRHLDTLQSNASPKDGWRVPRTTTGKAGWVVDPEGRHRFWVPVEWRAPWDPKNCHQDISTLLARIRDQPVMIKFKLESFPNTDPNSCNFVLRFVLYAVLVSLNCSVLGICMQRILGTPHCSRMTRLDALQNPEGIRRVQKRFCSVTVITACGSSAQAQ